MLLRGHLRDFLYPLSLSTAGEARITRAVLLYLNSRANSTHLRQATRELGISDQLYNFKASYLDRSQYTISHYWRASFSYFKHLPVPEGRFGPATTEMHEPSLKRAVESVAAIPRSDKKDATEDLRLMEDFLTIGDHEKLFITARHLDFESPSDTDLLPIIKKLQRYCGSLAYRKMRFIAQNDCGVSLDDLSAELFEAGLRTLREFDFEFDQELKLLNTAKVGAKNHCLRLIDFYTTQKRNRIVKIGERSPRPRVTACGNCAFFNAKVNSQASCSTQGVMPADKPCSQEGRVFHPRVITTEEVCGNCKHYDQKMEGAYRTCLSINIGPKEEACRLFEPRVPEQEYASTTASLDQPIYDRDNGTSMTLLDNQVDDSPNHEDETVNDEWTQDLLSRVPVNMQRVIKIVLGHVDDEFDRWLWGRTEKTPDSLTERQLARYACEFSSIPIKTVQSALLGTGSFDAASGASA